MKILKAGELLKEGSSFPRLSAEGFAKLLNAANECRINVTNLQIQDVFDNKKAQQKSEGLAQLLNAKNKYGINVKPEQIHG